MRYRIHGLFAGLLCLAFSVDGFASGLQATLDPARVAEGESAQLTLSAPADVTGTPDLSPLKQDFDLLGQSQSTHTRIINGQGSSSREWHIGLAPKRSGKLTVPALQWGGLHSKALSLEVLSAGKAAQQGMASPVLLEVAASPKHPYVQSEVIYTLRLLYRTDLQEASLSEPQVGNAIVERLGEDKRYNTDRDGQTYQVIERRYAIFPQSSGKLEIGSPVLSARIPDTRRQKGSRHGFFGGADPFGDIDSLFGSNGFPDIGMFTGQTRPVELRGHSVTLDIKPQPAAAMSPWLPAESLSLNEAWSPDPPQFHVGEAVTRTVAITAQGLSASQLPDLALSTAPGIKTYPDKAQAETHASGDTLVAQKTFKVAMIPSRTGSFTLPEIDLKWWDTAAGKVKTARIPGRDILVLPAVGGSASPSLSSAPPPQATAGAESGAQPNSSASNGAQGLSALSGEAHQALTSMRGYWPWLSAILACAWMGTAILWLRARNRGAPPEPLPGASAEVPGAKPGKWLKQLEQACRDNDPRAASQALLKWAAARWPELPPGGLETLAQRLGPDAREIVRQLDRGLYAKTRGDWDGAAAWSHLAPALEKATQDRRRPDREMALPPLYPQGA